MRDLVNIGFKIGISRIKYYSNLVINIVMYLNPFKQNYDVVCRGTFALGIYRFKQNGVANHNIVERSISNFRGVGWSNL